MRLISSTARLLVAFARLSALRTRLACERAVRGFFACTRGATTLRQDRREM